MTCALVVFRCTPNLEAYCVCSVAASPLVSCQGCGGHAQLVLPLWDRHDPVWDAQERHPRSLPINICAFVTGGGGHRRIPQRNLRVDAGCQAALHGGKDGGAGAGGPCACKAVGVANALIAMASVYRGSHAPSCKPKSSRNSPAN